MKGDRPTHLAVTIRCSGRRRDRLWAQLASTFDTTAECPAQLFSRSGRYATLACRSPIEASPASPIEMSRSSVCLRPVEVAWDDGDHDEPQRSDAPAGADRCRRRTDARGAAQDGAGAAKCFTFILSERCSACHRSYCSCSCSQLSGERPNALDGRWPCRGKSPHGR